MKKKLSVITGGSSGLGLASAQCLADKTALLLCARSEAGLAAAKKELETYGAEVYTFCMDVSDEDSVRGCAQYAASLGEIVNVIHAAGVSPANTAAEDILCINAMGPIYITEYFRPLLAEGGVLMLFSSTAGYMFETNEQMGALLPLVRKLFSTWQEPGFPVRLMDFLRQTMQLPETHCAGVAYCLSKYFVRWFTYANAWRFAKSGCRILSISPGPYMTRMHQALIDNQPESAKQVMQGIPLQRWGHAYEMGKLVEFLCSSGAGYITGVDILADGGCTFPAVTPQID